LIERNALPAAVVINPGTFLQARIDSLTE